MHTVREYYLSIGKLLGLAVVALVPGGGAGAVSVLLALTLSQYGIGLLVKDTARLMERYEREKPRRGGE